jgi:thymidine kinase
MYEPPYLKIYPGGMGGQKTSHLILDLRELRDGYHKPVIIFQPQNSRREGIDVLGKVGARSGISADVVVIHEERPEEILFHLRREHIAVGIPDAHMYKSPVVPVVRKILDQRRGVHVDFLIRNYGGLPFDLATELLLAADYCDRHYFGRCQALGCVGRPGTYSQLRVNGEVTSFTGPEPIVGDVTDGRKVQYTPVCPDHFTEPPGVQEWLARAAGGLKAKGKNVGIIREVVRACPYFKGGHGNVLAQNWILLTQAQWEREYQDLYDYVLCDRSLVDNFVYAQDAYKKEQEEVPAWVEPFVLHHAPSYHYLFKTPVVPDLLVGDGVRSIDQDWQHEMDGRIKQYLKENKIKHIELPISDGEKVEDIIEYATRQAKFMANKIIDMDVQTRIL